MWIEKIENSKGVRYKYSERFINPLTNRYFKLTVTLNANNRHAKKRALEMLQLKFNEKLQETKSDEEKRQEQIQHLSLKAFSDNWLEFVALTAKTNTVLRHRSNIKKIFTFIDVDSAFVDFTPAIAEKIVFDMYYKKQCSYSYVNSLLVTIKLMMRYAKKDNLISDISGFEEIKIKRRPITEQELEKNKSKFLNKDELKECLKQLKQIDNRIALAMEFIALTGLRCGELSALRVQDYNKQTSTISINGTITNTFKRETPKNVYSYRDVVLNDRAKQILEWFILENKKSALWNGKQYKDKGYIFTTRNGSPYRAMKINPVLKRIHIQDKNITTHIFRHTHISLLTEIGIPLKAIMQRVGHHNPNTTLKIYTHVTETMQKELSDKLQALNF